MKNFAQILQKPAAFLVDRLGMDRVDGSHRQLNEDIRALCGGRKEAVREYHLQKVIKILRAVFGILILIIILLAVHAGEENTVEGGVLERPGYGDTAREEELIADIEGDKRELVFQVDGRKYSAAQADELLEQALQELQSSYLGENASADMVRRDLFFQETFSDGAVKAEWTTVPYGVIADTGELSGQDEGKVPDEGCIVKIEAVLTCQDRTTYFDAAVNVYPKEMTTAEQLQFTVEKALKKAGTDSAEQTHVTLPDSVDGKRISWSYQENNSFVLVIFLLILIPVALGLRSDSKVKEMAQIRRRQLQMDYPELMWKMTMLLGAGLTISGAFIRIADDYRKEKREKNEKYIRYAYEEMLYACREMKSGIPEAKAYENFGRRCELPRYIKFGTLLSQNLKKGSKGLAAILEQEALSTSQERRAQARKMGEKAGTKMLLPMMLMLVVVLIILVVPAFLNM